MKKMNKQNHKMINLLTITVLVAIIVCTAGFAVSANSDKASSASDSYYKSVRISSGDTLWTIAQEYCPDTIDIHSYIDNIKSINDIKNNTIKTGEYIIVAIYN